MLYWAILLILFQTYVFTTEVEDLTEFHEKVALGDEVYRANAYPYFVSLQAPDSSSKTEYTHYCGGVLIRRRIMITAAHCFKDVSTFQVTRVLPNYRNTRFIGRNDLTFKITKYVTHPEYSEQKQPFTKHDIAVAQLDKDDPRPNATLQLPIKLLTPGTKVIMMGFGRTKFNVSSDRLRDATVFIRSDYECLQGMEESAYSRVDNICVSNDKGSTGCPGDSGSPLVWNDPRTRASYLIGVAASGQLVCLGGGYTSYVNVFTHWKFINDALNSLAADG